MKTRIILTAVLLALCTTAFAQYGRYPYHHHHHGPYGGPYGPIEYRWGHYYDQYGYPVSPDYLGISLYGSEYLRARRQVGWGSTLTLTGSGLLLGGSLGAAMQSDFDRRVRADYSRLGSDYQSGGIHSLSIVSGVIGAAFLGAGISLPKHKQMIMTVKDADKPEAVGVARRFQALGYKIYATRSTAKYLNDHGIDALWVNKISQESPNVMDLILGHKIDLVIDTPTQGHGDKTRDGFLIRRNAIETGVYCITAMDTANALATSLENASDQFTLVDIAKVKNA